MTRAQIVARVSLGVQRDDLVASYNDIVNEALTEIQRDRSWVAMKSTARFTVHAGNSSVSLLTDDSSIASRFKELTIEKSPVHLQSSIDNVLVPCDVWTREKVLRRQARLISNSLLYSVYSHPNTARRVQVPVYIDWQAGNPSLNVLFSAQNDLPFTVSFYGYLADLVADGDTNYFTLNYPEMVIARSKAIAFEAVNDPVSVEFEQVYQVRFKKAAAQDAYQAVAGVELRM